MNDGVISANTMRRRMGLAPAPPAKHKLVIWPEAGFPPFRTFTFKCVKCTRGAFTIDRLVVREFIKGNVPELLTKDIAWGSWGICREDLDHPLNQPLERN